MIIPWEERKGLNRNVIEEPDRRPNDTFLVLRILFNTHMCVTLG